VAWAPVGPANLGRSRLSRRPQSPRRSTIKQVLRIVPLLASGTEIVHALGLGKYQVGRSHECDFPIQVQDLPVCTRPGFAVDGSSADIDRQVKATLEAAASLYEVLPGALDSLRPTHVITQTQCKVCAVSVEDVTRALSESLAARPTVVALEPNSLADIWSDIRSVANACGIDADAEVLVSSLQRRMRTIAETAAQADNRPTVACIEWHEPLMAAGNWVPELIAMAGGDNLFGVAGEHSPWMTWEQLVLADPDILITMPCGFDLTRTRNEMHWLTARLEWNQLRAVRRGRVFLADGNQYLNRPGPRIVESLQILAEILHPELFPPDLEGTAWQSWRDA
jgi:iron complex transport system substrate-binding protein